jgi:hypothetical protein
MATQPATQTPAQLARLRLARATRLGDPEQIDEARRALDDAKLDAKVREIIDRAPELTPAQYADLARALGVVPETAEAAGNDAA